MFARTIASKVSLDLISMRNFKIALAPLSSVFGSVCWVCMFCSSGISFRHLCGLRFFHILSTIWPLLAANKNYGQEEEEKKIAEALREIRPQKVRFGRTFIYKFPELAFQFDNAFCRKQKRGSRKLLVVRRGVKYIHGWWPNPQYNVQHLN